MQWKRLLRSLVVPILVGLLSGLMTGNWAISLQVSGLVVIAYIIIELVQIYRTRRQK